MGKLEAETLERIDIRWFKKKGFLKGNHSNQVIYWTRGGKKIGSVSFDVCIQKEIFSERETISIQEYLAQKGIPIYEQSNEPICGQNDEIITHDDYIRVYYTTTYPDGRKEYSDYKIKLAKTRCNFGGFRYWFVCPLVKDGKYCGRRVAVLYLVGKYFGCRHCYNLTYASRNLSGIYKVIGKTLPDWPPTLKEFRELFYSTKFYKGKITKRYKRYLKMEEKRFMETAMLAEYFRTRTKGNHGKKKNI
jgi:hypothetical protein